MQLDDVAGAVRSGLRWMQASQQQGGSWHADDPLSRIHATTRCVRAFHGCGFPPDYSTLVHATRYLLRPQSEGIYHYFWRLGALSELPGISNVTLDHDFADVRNAVNSGMGLDTRLNYHAFLLDCAANCGRGQMYSAEASQLESRLGTTITDPTPLLWGYVALERAGYPPSEQAKELVVRRLLESLQVQAGGQHLSDLATATSFVVFNVSRSPTLSNDKKVVEAVLNCVRWLVARQDPKGFWPLEAPLYNGDPRSQSYVTGVAVRALTEYMRRFSPTTIAHVFVQDWRFRLILSVAVRWSSVVALSITVALVFFLLVPGNVGILVAGLGLIASLIEIGVFLARLRGMRE